MRLFLSIFFSLSLTLLLCAPASYAESVSNQEITSDKSAYVEGEVLVTLEENNVLPFDKNNSDSSDMEVENTWDFGDVAISEVSSEELSTKELIDTLEENENVIAVEPNYYRKKLSTNDTYRNYQWYLNGDGAFSSSSLGIQESKMPTQETDNSPIVAVVDTGIDYTHEDLKEHMWINPYSSLKGTYGYDFGDKDSDPMDEDTDGHGTHCAGIISGIRNNSTGISGISNSRLMALKIFDREDNATDSSIISAFNYIYNAQLLGANIAAVNCSWGGGGATPTSIKTLIEKIGKNGSLFVFAAGNDGVNHDVSGTDCPYDIDRDYVVIVGATNIHDNKACFSDYGKSKVDLFAPGDMIVSTVNSDVFSPSFYTDEKRQLLCSYFSSCDTNDTTLYAAPQIGLKNDYITYGTITHSNQDYFNQKNSGSLLVPINATRADTNCTLYLDVTGLNLSSRKSYYISYEMGTMKNGSISWTHYTSLRNGRSFYSYQGRTYLCLTTLNGDFRSTPEIYIDNPAISVATTTNISFGKYNVLNGTSMATPAVSAAVALLSQQYPTDTATERRSRLLQCIRPLNSLTDYCITGGTLDLSKITTCTLTQNKSNTTENNTLTSITKENTSTPQKKVKVKKIKLNKKKATLRYGKKLKLKATVTPTNATNKKIKWTISSKKYATVSSKGVVKAKKRGIGKTVKVYAKAKDGSGKKAICTVKIRKKK